MEKKKKLGTVAQYGGKYFLQQSLCHMKLSKMAERNIECLNVMISVFTITYCSLYMKQETFVLPYMMKPLQLLV